MLQKCIHKLNDMGEFCASMDTMTFEPFGSKVIFFLHRQKGQFVNLAVGVYTLIFLYRNGKKTNICSVPGVGGFIINNFIDGLGRLRRPLQPPNSHAANEICHSK